MEANILVPYEYSCHHLLLYCTDVGREGQQDYLASGPARAPGRNLECATRRGATSIPVLYEYWAVGRRLWLVGGAVMIRSGPLFIALVVIVIRHSITHPPPRLLLLLVVQQS